MKYLVFIVSLILCGVVMADDTIKSTINTSNIREYKRACNGFQKDLSSDITLLLTQGWTLHYGPHTYQCQAMVK